MSLWVLVLLSLAPHAATANDAAAASQPLEYKTHIAPLLAKHCADCHDAKKADAEYRVDTYQALLKGGESLEPAVVVGKPDESPLIQYLTGKRTPRMPRKRKALADAEIELIRDWIKQGAKEGKPAAPRFTDEQIEFFEISIRPLLAQHCFECHGDDKARGQLSMNARPELLEGGATGPAIVPGKSADSLLIKAVRHSTDLRMPKGRAKLQDKEIALLEKWIAMGAPWLAVDDKDAPKIRKRFTIYESDRAHWAFQPVQRPSLPSTQKPEHKTWANDDLDQFILARLESNNLSPAPRASRRTLMRRLSFALTGLPPSPKDFETHLNSDDDPTLSRYVDELIASESFGEHWGRHWLDHVRFRPFPKRSESNDPYRQWVIDAFNNDMPFDQFLKMQIAGDLLPPSKSDEVHLDGMIAVRPWSLKNRHHQQIDLLGRTFMGLSLICARCHDHKLEPVSRDDYYALLGIFESSQVIDAPYIREKDRFEDYMAGFKRMTANEARMKKELKEFSRVARLVDLQNRIEAERQKLGDPKQSKEKIQANIDKLLKDEEKTLADIKKRKIDLDAPQAKEYMALRAENNAFNEKWKGQFLFDAFIDQERSKIADASPPAMGTEAKVGDDTPPEPPVARRFPVMLAGANQTPLGKQTQQSGRLELAKWLANADHPITARLMVNRIWYYMLGEGLTPSLSNFGRSGRPPTHPQLLDYLSDEFVKNNWSMKQLIRRIALSSTFQQTSQLAISRDERDQRLQLFGIARSKRLEVESIWRTIQLLEYGWEGDDRREPPIDFTREMRLLFDGPDVSLIVPRRTASVSPLQALFLMNNDYVKQSTERFAQRLLTLKSDRDRIQRAFVLLFGREATSDEINTGETFVANWQVALSEDANKRRKPDAPSPEAVARWQAYLQVLLLSNEFMFVD